MSRAPRTRVENSGGNSWGRRGGREGLAAAREERKKATERSNFGPWRFGLKAGQEAEIVILDNSIDDLWFMYEHTFYDRAAKPPVQNHMCCSEFEDCPICDEIAENSKSPYNARAYTMFMSVIEMAPEGGEPLFTDKEGVEHFHTKRLMAVKATQASELERLLDAAENRNGTLRGTVILMARDSGQQSARTGKPVIMPSGEAFEFMAEEDLLNDFGHDAVVRDGKTVRPENDDIAVYDYTKMFPKPSAATIASATGLSVAPGSPSDIASTLDDDDTQEEETTSPRSGRTRSRSRVRDEGSEEEQAPARTRSRSRSRAQTEEPPQEEEASPPSRSRSRPRGRSAATGDAADIPM